MGLLISYATTISRRSLLASLIAACPGMARSPLRAQEAGAPGIERETMASGARAAGLTPPLTLGMGRVVLRSGASSWAAMPGGLRLIVVEAGVLGLSVPGLYAPPLDANALAISGVPPDLNEEVLLPAGAAIAIGAQGIAVVRNPAARPVVVLDTVVYEQAPRPLARAFTTESGVSFQLLASASASAAPSGRVAVTLERVRLGAAADLPPDLSQGLTLMYIEVGALELLSRAGTVFAARAAASAPYALPGAFREIPAGAAQRMTAGGVIFLPASTAARLSNASERPAKLLALSVRERP